MIKTQKVIVPFQRQFKAASLRLHRLEWAQITRDPICLQAIHGAKLPLLRKPPISSPPEKVLREERVDPVIDTTVHDLLQMGVIREIPVETKVFLSRVFTVPKKERGKEYGRRFILNLKVSLTCFSIDFQKMLKFTLLITEFFRLFAASY